MDRGVGAVEPDALTGYFDGVAVDDAGLAGDVPTATEGSARKTVARTTYIIEG
jgi:hypothetical protein|tara:strand:+ start:1811 stop:1969 length:159 start_codon:yes stop_codon:yes gene_type:complete